MLKKVFSLLFFSLLGTSFVKAEVNPETKVALKSNLYYLHSVLSTAYAPRYWKQRHLKWDADAQLQVALAKVDAAQNVFQYREALTGFLNSTQDYHVGYSFLATGVSTLPFMVRTVEGKTIVVWVNQSKLNPQIYPIEAGDEILSMNSVPVREVLDSLRGQVSGSNKSTDWALADLALTRRRAARNLEPQIDPVNVTLKKKGSEKTLSLQLMWEVTPESIRGFSTDTQIKVAGLIKSPQMSASMMKDFKANPDPSNLHWIGQKKSFLPALGTPIWSSEEADLFQAYIFEQDGKKVGFVRIPSYSPESTVLAAFQFSKIVKKFQEEVDLMLIDQLNNPGGSVFYLYALASMLTDTSLSTPRHRMSLFPSDIRECADIETVLGDIKSDEDVVKLLGPSVDGYPSSYMVGLGIRQYCRFLTEQYNQGKRLSDPYFIFGVDRVNPHPLAQFTKPIIVLINELDFSGGDFFPAILQDNARVTLVGTRTSGAGGYVLEAKFTNSFGLEGVNFTGSIAERVDRNPIENLGVVPDVNVEMTVNDYQNGFVDYLQKVKAVVSDKLK
jgi:hypothetical protein